MTGVELIAAERTRQIEEKGYTAELDDRWDNLALVFCADMIIGDYISEQGGVPPEDAPAHLGWHAERANHVRKKYGPDYITRLKIAGAFIAAEIDRLTRRASKP